MTVCRHDICTWGSADMKVVDVAASKLSVMTLK